MSLKPAIVVAAVAIALSGCNAARGLGQDIENLGLLMQGKKIQKREPVQQEVVVSEVVTSQPAPAEMAAPASAGVEVTPLPEGGQVEVYPYPYPQDGAAQTAYPPPVPAQPAK